MAYKCICGTYVFKFLELCRQCRGEHGYYSDWPEWVRSRYFDLNFGGDYEFGEMDKLGRPNSVKGAPLGKAGDILKEVQDPQLGERSGKRCPVCQARIKPKQRLCRKCFIEYGGNEAKWDQWLIALVTDDQRIADNERDHRELAINDETALSKKDMTLSGGEGYKTPGSLGGRTYARHNQNELDREALAWGDGELEGSGDLPELGAIKGDRNGYKYNQAAWRGSGIEYTDISAFSERASMDDVFYNTARIDQELEKSDYTRQIVILLYGAGHKQWEIAELLGIDQQRVSDILKKRP